METKDKISSKRDRQSIDTKALTRLLDQVAGSMEIFRKVANRSSGNPIGGQFLMWHLKKAEQYDQLGRVLNTDLEKHSLSFQRRFSLELEKIWVELNHLIIRLDLKELVAICIKREEKLLAVYNEIIAMRPKYIDFEAILHEQRLATQQILKELKRMERGYDFLNRE